MADPTPAWPPPPGRVLGFGVAFALLLSLVSWLLYLFSGDYYIPELDVGGEGSVAAWASSLALFGGAIAAWSLGGRDRPRRRTPWRALAVLFAFLSLDETASIHEKTIEPLQEGLGAGGALVYAWVIPGGLTVALVGLAFVPFLRDVERTTARLLLVAGVIYVGGALGVESMTGALALSVGEGHWLYGTVATVEELAEMLGITAFLATLARYDRHLAGLSDGPVLGPAVGRIVEFD